MQCMPAGLEVECNACRGAPRVVTRGRRASRCTPRHALHSTSRPAARSTFRADSLGRMFSACLKVCLPACHASVPSHGRPASRSVLRAAFLPAGLATCLTGCLASGLPCVSPCPQLAFGPVLRVARLGGGLPPGLPRRFPLGGVLRGLPHGLAWISVVSASLPLGVSGSAPQRWPLGAGRSATGPWLPSWSSRPLGRDPSASQGWAHGILGSSWPIAIGLSTLG